MKKNKEQMEKGIIVLPDGEVLVRNSKENEETIRMLKELTE